MTGARRTGGSPGGARDSSNPPWPAHFTGAGNFERAFSAGRVALTYHKLGPRPAAVRLKGLYVGVSRFRRHLGGLAAAGVRACGVGDLAAPAGEAATRTAAITFDDGFANVLDHGLEPLARHGYRAIQFLVADEIGGENRWEQAEGEAPERLMDTAQIQEWLAAGHAIGAHTRSHPHLTQVTKARAREEISGSRKKLEDQFGLEIRHFCYPYGDWNEEVRDLVAGAGFWTACTTEPGVNRPGEDPFALRRFTARYPSRSWRTLAAAIRRWRRG